MVQGDRRAAKILQMEAVSKTWRAGRALDSVSLAIEPGEMVALIGPSGSGKSTLLRIAAGLLEADRGSGPVSLFGRPVQEDGQLSRGVRRVRARVGFVFQQFNLVGRVSLYANALFGALGQMPAWRGALGLFPVDVRRRTMEALERVGVADHAGKRASTLSGGQQQRGAIARALVQRAEAIFADEPIASLDPVSARRVMRLLSQLNREDAITVFVTLHQVDYALKYCRRAIALKAGRIAYDGPIEGLTRDRLIDIYGDEYRDVMDDGEAGP